MGKLNGTIRELQREIENIKFKNSNQVSQQDAIAKNTETKSTNRQL